MKTAGVVFDFYDDPTGSVLKKAFPAPDELPEQIKVAHILSSEEHDVLRDEAYALRMNNEGKILRKFACVDAGNTLLSMLYLEEAASVLPDEAIKTAAVNIAEFAEQFGLGLTPFVKTAATGMGRNRDSMRQPMVGDEADWAQRTNLVSVRGGADSGRVIPTANQMKTASMEKESMALIELMAIVAAVGVSASIATVVAKKYMARHNGQIPDNKEQVKAEVRQIASQVEKEKKSGVEKTAGRDDVIKKKFDFLKDWKKLNPMHTEKNPAQPAPGPLKDPNSFAIGPGKGDLEVNFKSVVDVSNIAPKMKFKKTSAVKTASGRYPLDSYGDVQAAVRYFDEHWTEMTPAQRHEYAVPVTERIEELQIKTASELLGRYGSTEYAPDLEAHIASRKASAPQEFRDSYNLLKEKRSSVTPDQFVELLSEVDRAAGLNWHYGASICDPYLATYGGKEKSASAEPWSWSNADGISVSQEQLQELAQSEAINHNFGQDVGSAFKSDPIGIFESMPDNSKTIMATLAKGMEKTSGWGAKAAEALKKKGLFEVTTKAAKIKMGK